MTKMISIFFILIIISLTSKAQNTGVFIVNITGINEIEGIVYVNIYNSKDGFPTEPEKAMIIKQDTVTSKSITVRFENIEDGYYAVSVYHDENSNKELDTNFLGIPNEPIGVSNNAHGTMGPPSFEDAMFNFINNKSIVIELN